jgi:hypothetical protein
MGKDVMHHVNKNDVEIEQRMEMKNVMNEVIMGILVQHVQVHVKKLVCHVEVKINERHTLRVNRQHHG